MGGDDEGRRAVEEPSPVGLPQHGRARLAGQVVIAQHQVEAAAAQRFEATLGIGGLGDPIALCLQGDGEELPGVVVVLHEEDLLARGAHGDVFQYASPLRTAQRPLRTSRGAARFRVCPFRPV